MPWNSTEEKKKPDLSYLSAQPPPTYTETAGMPTAMAAIASRNLAVEDAGNARINAVNRNNITPGVGAPGSTQQSDAGNLAIADSMERSDRGQRFGFGSQQYAQNTDTPTAPAATDPGGIDIGIVNDRRTKILRGIDPDAPAIYPNAKRKHEMLGELNILSNIAHDHALTTARDSHDAYRQQRDIESSTQFAGLLNGLRNSQTKPGTREHAAELLDLALEFPLGAKSQAGLMLLKQHGGIHKDLAEVKSLRERIAEFTAETGQAPESIETTATGGVNLRGKAKGDKTPDAKQFKDEVAGLNLKPYAFENPDAWQTDAKTGKRFYKDDTMKETTTLDAKHYQELQARYDALHGREAKAPAVDKMALAKQALSDPNASEAHKAAARKILGQ